MGSILLQELECERISVDDDGSADRTPFPERADSLGGLPIPTR